MTCPIQRQNDENYCPSCNQRWDAEEGTQCRKLATESAGPVHRERAAPYELAGEESLALRIARTIIGPQDPTHVGPDMLQKLQRHRWEKQTSPAERMEAWNSAVAIVRDFPGIDG